MTLSPRTFRSLMAVCLAVSAAGVAHAQQAQSQFEPQVGQAGKDVVWVPTPYELVEKMLDMAKVTPQDLVVDLGSGDGRNVIAAAKRGARALGVEYNADMVELSKRMAAKEGVPDKATFVQGDMFEADFSKATVLALFLLPDNMDKLRTKFLDLPLARASSRTPSASRAGMPTRRRQSATVVRAGAGRCCGSCPQKSKAHGDFRKRSSRSSKTSR